MNVQGLTYFESAKVSWLLIWRGAVIGSVIGFIFGVIAAFIEMYFGLSDEWGRAIITLGSIIIGVIFLGPLLIKMMMAKRFDGFRLKVVRVSQ